MRVLIIENEVSLARGIADYIHKKGHDAKVCEDGECGLTQSLSLTFDLVILNIQLPRRDGYSVLVNLRQKKTVPVIMLADAKAASRRVESLQAGADDFLQTPVNLSELFVRIEALFRRVEWSIKPQAKNRETLAVGELTLSRNAFKAFYAGEEIPLTPIQFRLLWVLVENRNEVLSKPYLYRVVLERAFNRYDRSLDMHLSRVRKKLVNSGMTPERFSTIHGKGYRFV